MRDLLLEIGVEEIPSAYMPSAVQSLKELVAQKLGEARLSYEEVSGYGTPRRLVLLVKGLVECQEDAVIENRGPKKNIAFDKEGQPSKAGLGFARAQGLEFSDLLVREVDGVEYLFAVKKESGKDSMDLLPDILHNVINSIPFPKSMRWAYFSTRFARPIRWLLTLFGEQIVPLAVENVSSSNITWGHRFLASGPIQVDSISAYFEILEKNYVILDQDQRRAMIWQQVQKVAADQGGKAMENDDLLDEINYLVEYPTAFFGSFSPSYLEVPPEVLTTSMIEHQRYFPVFDPKGKLLPGFIGVRNGTEYSLDKVRSGNERVIKARLEDALFFWKEDTKKSLDDMAAGFKDVLFHERLGSLQDKVDRLKKLAVVLGKASGLSDAGRLERAAALCKADLLSSMVYEFPELQGVMGRYYALVKGEEQEVSQAILEHYLPRYAGGELPVTGTGMVLSLSEKFDNLVGCFAIGIKPTGSQDPYALRRQALGIVNIVLERSLDIDIKECCLVAYDSFEGIKPENSREDTAREVLDFILQRLRGVLLERGYSYDVIDAVLQMALQDLKDVHQRVECLQAFKQAPLFEDFMVVFNRSNNLSRKWEQDGVDESALQDPSEIALYQAVRDTEKSLLPMLKARDYDAALKQLASLRSFIDNFFGAVMVMVEDEQLKAARLGMLRKTTVLCKLVADFGKLVY
ncbi:MAG: glycine--tRNA ligase subunit beta [Syntrophomonas sp.]